MPHSCTAMPLLVYEVPCRDCNGMCLHWWSKGRTWRRIEGAQGSSEETRHQQWHCSTSAWKNQHRVNYSIAVHRHGRTSTEWTIALQCIGMEEPAQSEHWQEAKVKHVVTYYQKRRVIEALWNPHPKPRDKFQPGLWQELTPLFTRESIHKWPFQYLTDHLSQLSFQPITSHHHQFFTSSHYIIH